MRLSNSDYVLLAYIFFLVPLMLVGFGFARRRLFVPHHKLTMTAITIINWGLIIWLMLNTYRAIVGPRIPGGLSEPHVLLGALHGLFGTIAQIVATYLVLRMWFENQLPEWIKVKNIKRWMRFTLGMWLLTALLGIGVWFTIYQRFRVTAATPTPTVTAPVGTQPATPGGTSEATPAGTQAATPGATQDATTAATPAATPAATADAPATPAATPAATTNATTIATPAATPAQTEDAVASTRTSNSGPGSVNSGSGGNSGSGSGGSGKSTPGGKDDNSGKGSG